ncbi:MAG: dihydropteroate synthase [Pseudomonadota bacterium]
MLIVGERINTSRGQIDEAVQKRDAAFIQTEVRAQMGAGAEIIDVNAGTRARYELDDLLWLIDAAQETGPVRLSLDSSNPHCLLEAVERVRDLPMLNSTTAEKGRFEKMIPVIQKRECDVVALCLDDRGLPKSADQVIENAERLVHDLEAIGVKRERIFLDPMIQAVSTDSRAGLKALEAIERIRSDFVDVKIICGLSNISYALPKRSIINQTFLALAMRAGLSAALIDPLDKKMMGTLLATAMLLGQDDYCLNFIRAFREGRLGD